MGQRNTFLLRLAAPDESGITGRRLTIRKLFDLLIHPCRIRSQIGRREPHEDRFSIRAALSQFETAEKNVFRGHAPGEPTDSSCTVGNFKESLPLVLDRKSVVKGKSVDLGGR